jgi:hypothetical protein
MSHRYDTSLIYGAYVYGVGSLGILGSAIPSTGDSGAGYAYNDLTLPADSGKEICGRVTSWPTNGTLFAYEDTSFEYTALSDGADSFQYQLYVDGIATGSPTTVTLSTGAVPVTIICALGTADATGKTATITNAAPTIGRPSSDISTGAWVPSTGSTLYPMLDEETPDDLDYISTTTLNTTCKLNLNATQYPGSASQQLSVRASSSTGNGLRIVLKDGLTAVKTQDITLTPTLTTYPLTLTAGEILNISTGVFTVEITSI